MPLSLFLLKRFPHVGKLKAKNGGFPLDVFQKKKLPSGCQGSFYCKVLEDFIQDKIV